MKKPYDDILHMPHHVSQNHPQMSMRDRAAQFSPFAALTGYEDAIGETGRLTEQKRELSEHEQAELNLRLNILAVKLKENPEISIEYFVPDERKVGGAYVIISGKVAKLSLSDRTIVMEDGSVIRIGDIVEISEILEQSNDERNTNE